VNEHDEPLFLARESYRRRRLMDAARFLPFVGAFVFIVPSLWANEATTAEGMMFLFGGWLVLIVVAAVMSRRLSPLRGSAPSVDPDGDNEGV